MNIHFYFCFFFYPLAGPFVVYHTGCRPEVSSEVYGPKCRVSARKFKRNDVVDQMKTSGYNIVCLIRTPYRREEKIENVILPTTGFWKVRKQRCSVHFFSLIFTGRQKNVLVFRNNKCILYFKHDPGCVYLQMYCNRYIIVLFLHRIKILLFLNTVCRPVVRITVGLGDEIFSPGDPNVTQFTGSKNAPDMFVPFRR